jgi:hypothetical protein
VVAIVPDENDIALAKVVAWREKDVAWLKDGVASDILSLAKMRDRIPEMPAADPARGVPSPGQLLERLRILGTQSSA